MFFVHCLKAISKEHESHIPVRCSLTNKKCTLLKQDSQEKTIRHIVKPFDLSAVEELYSFAPLLSTARYCEPIRRIVRQSQTLYWDFFNSPAGHNLLIPSSPAVPNHCGAHARPNR